MGKPVLCDSDDLEALLNAAVFGREAERMLKTLKGDPAMMRVQGTVEGAMQRINRARAEAIKPEELKLPPVAEVRLPPDDKERLKELDAAGPLGIKTDNAGAAANLFLAGLAARAQCNEHIRWGDGSDPQVQLLMWQRVRITDRGRQWLELHP